MPNSLTYNEAVETILFKQNALTILLFCQNWMRYVTLAQTHGYVFTGLQQEPRARFAYNENMSTLFSSV